MGKIEREGLIPSLFILTFLKIYVIIYVENEKGEKIVMLLLQILYILGIGTLSGVLMYALIYCLANFIWGAMTWRDDD